ncbi:hypothetical protein GS506_21485 [Rhodococcus hoagii]|nr:hypothetical protein [Prescottella equi]
MLHIGRLPERSRESRADLDSVLDACAVGTLATVVDGLPWTVPMLYARSETGYCCTVRHGRRAAPCRVRCAPASLCVTLLDGIVVADNLFNSSANYRSAVVHGNLTPLRREEAECALVQLSDALHPGPQHRVRASTRKELAATPHDRTADRARPLDGQGAGRPAERGRGTGIRGCGRGWYRSNRAGEPIRAPWVSDDLRCRRRYGRSRSPDGAARKDRVNAISRWCQRCVRAAHPGAERGTLRSGRRDTTLRFSRKTKRKVMADLAYVGLIIGVFAVCALVLRGLQTRSVR